MRALLVVVIAACAEAGSIEVPEVSLPVPTNELGEPLPSAGTATLRDGTIVLPASVTKDAAVDFYGITFPAAGNEALLALVRGNVIVSGTGDGFVRRVYAVEPASNTIRIVTSPATLADAVTDAAFHMSATEALWTPGILDGGNEHLVAAIAGEMTFAPAIELDFALDGEGLRTFDLAVTGAGTARVAGSIDFTTTTHRGWGDERDWTRPLFRRVYALGPLPIVVVGQLTTTLGAAAYVEDTVRFTSGADAVLDIDAASHYTRQGGWTMTDASHVEVAQDPASHLGVGHASLSIGIAPKIELSFYGQGGVTLNLVMQTGALGTYCGPALVTALRTAVQGTVTYQLAPLVKSSRTDVTLWDRREFLDELEACTR